ncbi:MAG: efflux RND transporter periplasmic adaptor subunit [Nitrospiraceae bacterium]|jgi:RND family efflux transporter MFP subunit|nr:MAG: efflux RND transporter periplasmic adaptor subunit [Nitrospiraceae bacterium]
MQQMIFSMVLLLLIIVSSFSTPFAQDKKAGAMPPALVVVDEVHNGMIAPDAEFVGTVYYEEVSDVASEVSGSVESVYFEEGMRVKKGNTLVQLNSDLIEKSLGATTASYEQGLSDLEQARVELERAENLRKEELISEQRYDIARFRVRGLAKKVLSLQAEVERLELELQKRKVKVPFNGVILKKKVDRGEWLSEGSPVATIAKDDMVDIIVAVPEAVVRHIKEGMIVEIQAGERKAAGEIIAVIPQGDLSTRTFPVKIRARNDKSFMEGMEARARLPVDEKKKGFIVPRDAVISVFGSDAVFVVHDGKAKMIPVNVIGYQGVTVGLLAEGITEAMKVVVKGNERLRDGQEVTIQQ